MQTGNHWHSPVRANQEITYIFSDLSLTTSLMPFHSTQSLHEDLLEFKTSHAQLCLLPKDILSNLEMHEAKLVFQKFTHSIISNSQMMNSNEFVGSSLMFVKHLCKG